MELRGMGLADADSGSASISFVTLEPGLGALAKGLVEEQLSCAVELLGMRVLDGEGRELDLPGAVVIVGFRRENKGQEG